MARRFQFLDRIAWNTVLVESRFHPDPINRKCGPRPRLLSDGGIRFLSPVQDNSLSFSTPFYAPSIPHLLDSLLELVKCPKNYMILDPGIYIEHFIRYLFLEQIHQQMKILPAVTEHHRAALENRLNRYKRVDKSKGFSDALKNMLNMVDKSQGSPAVLAARNVNR
jgi:hypothetical protein